MSPHGCMEQCPICEQGCPICHPCKPHLVTPTNKPEPPEGCNGELGHLDDKEVDEIMQLIAAHNNTLYQRVVDEVIGKLPEGNTKTDDAAECNHTCHLITERLLKHDQLKRAARIFGKGE